MKTFGESVAQFKSQYAEWERRDQWLRELSASAQAERFRNDQTQPPPLIFQIGRAVRDIVSPNWTFCVESHQRGTYVDVIIYDPDKLASEPGSKRLTFSGEKDQISLCDRKGPRPYPANSVGCDLYTKIPIPGDATPSWFVQHLV